MLSKFLLSVGLLYCSTLATMNPIFLEPIYEENSELGATYSSVHPDKKILGNLFEDLLTDLKPQKIFIDDFMIMFKQKFLVMLNELNENEIIDPAVFGKHDLWICALGELSTKYDELFRNKILNARGLFVLKNIFRRIFFKIFMAPSCNHCKHFSARNIRQDPAETFNWKSSNESLYDIYRLKEEEEEEYEEERTVIRSKTGAMLIKIFVHKKIKPPTFFRKCPLALRPRVPIFPTK